MKLSCLLFFIYFGTAVFAQQEIPAGNFWPVGACPRPPADARSFLLTAHSSDGRAIKVYYEVKVRGNDVPENWKALIRKLPRGSTVYFSEIVIIQNGEKKFLPAVKYIMW